MTLDPHNADIVKADSDAELLHKYVDLGSRTAFDALVRRHFDVVNAVCLRRLGDRQLAEDATQVVFMVLARRASTLSRREFLPAWLFKTARLTTMDIRRQEIRRKRYEGQATVENTREASHRAASWQDVEPIIDDLLARLKTDDRNAILLRFYADEDFETIASSLRISPEAARMRVSRGLRKLRNWLQQEGIGVTSATLLTWLTTSITERGMAPSHLVGHILDPSAGSNTILLTKGVLKTMSTLKIAAMAASVVVTTVVVTGGLTMANLAGVRTRSAANVRTTTAAQWSTRLPDGTDLRLATILMNREDHQTSDAWAPDGSRLPSVIPSGEKVVYSDTVLMSSKNTADAQQHNFATRPQSSLSVIAYTNASEPVEAVMDTVRPNVSQPANVDIALYVAKGPLKKLVEGSYTAGDTQMLATGERVTITKAVKRRGIGNGVDTTELSLTLPEHFVQSQCGFSLDTLNSSGAVVQTPHGAGLQQSANASDPRTAQLHCYFRSQELANMHVAQFRFSYRPIYHIIFSDVVINPAGKPQGYTVKVGGVDGN